jgi:hypothetical protein
VSARRYARPRIRRLVARNGRRLYVFELRCRCGWTRLIAGSQNALVIADAHWHAHRDPRRRSA